MNPAVLELRDVHYKFPGQDRATLNGASLRLGQGQSLGIVGDNGSGKSTLLRILSTLLAPQTGEVLYSGSPLNSCLHTVRPRISYSAGAPLGFYPRLTGRENLQLFASFKNSPFSKPAADALLQRVGLAQAAGQIYFRYSLGMRQRLHLARLCLPPFDFVFVDEPSNGLDQDGQFLLEDLFSNELRDSTKVVISHDLALLARLTARRLRLYNGVLHDI